MFDFIPVTIYTSLQYHVLLIIAVIILMHAFSYDIQDQRSIYFFNALGIIVAILYTLYMGQRQVNYRFGDTVNYNQAYQLLLAGKVLIIKKDFLFNYMMVLSSKIMSVRSFFQVVDVIYVIPCIIFSYKYFGRYWFFAFFMFLASFSFWSYGVNGLRNGLGTSIFILGLCFYDRKILMYACFVISYFMHASLVIPVAAFVASGLYKSPKMYIYIWAASIPLSLAGGSVWTNFFGSLGFAEDRTQGYLTGGEQYSNQFSQTGFRWDFLIYSAFAVFAGWYYIFKKNVTEGFYVHIFGMYCVANAFWVLVINAAFSNRFAYLSWFLMPIVIMYPLFKYKIVPDQYKMIGLVIISYFMFTYLMNVILYKA